MVEQRPAQFRRAGLVELRAVLFRLLANRGEPGIERRQDRLGLDAGLAGVGEQRELFVLGREIRNPQLARPQLAQRADPLVPAGRIPAREVQPGAGAIGPFAFVVLHRPLDEAAEAALEGLLELRVLGEEFLDDAEVVARGLAHFEGRQRRPAGGRCARALGREPVDLLERPRMVNARILLAGRLRLPPEHRPVPGRDEVGADQEQLEPVRVRLPAERLERADDHRAVFLGHQALHLGRVRESQQPQIVLGDRRERALRGGVRHLLALHLREVHDDRLGVVRDDPARAESVVQHAAARRQRSDRVERLDRLRERRVGIAEPALFDGRGRVRHRRAGTLAERLGDRRPERLGGLGALRGGGGRDDPAQRFERAAGGSALRQTADHDVGERFRLLEGALRRDRGQGLRDLHEPLVVVVLDELEGRLLDPAPALLGGETRRQFGEQRATIVVLLRVAEAPGEQQRELEIVGVDRPRARERVNPLASWPSPSCACTSNLAAACVCSSASDRSAIAASGSHCSFAATFSPSWSSVCCARSTSPCSAHTAASR